MNIFSKLLPIILISIVLYLLFYNLYPRYQEALRLAQKLNELKNKEREINTMEKFIQTLSQNANIKQLIENKEVLDLWLPRESKIEELIYFLHGIYNINGDVFKGTDFQISSESKSLNPNILPIKVVDFKLQANLKLENLPTFIDGLEKSVRLMKIKKANLYPDKTLTFDVESYYLPPQ